MGCNCKKNKVPQTPDELHAQEMNEWNGGLPQELTEEEIDWFNNIDIIEPIEPKDE